MHARPSPVPAAPSGPVSACTVAWRMRGRLYLTVVVKATFALVAEGRMSVVEPDPIAAGEQPDPGGIGLRTAGDLAPFLGEPEVWLTGHAAVPARLAQAAIHVELIVVQGGAARVDKQVELDVAGAAGQVVSIAGMGPLAADWPLRSRWLQGMDVPRPSGPVLDIPDAMSWEYFQTAPLDQRLGPLLGDETLVLGGMVARRPRLRTQLPAARAVARLYRRASPAPRTGEAVPLQADTLQIDVDRLRCSILWRGRVQLASEAELGALRLVAGLHPPGEAPVWADPFETEEAEHRSSSAPPAPMKAGEKLAGTMALTAEDVAKIEAMAATPFGEAAAQEPYTGTSRAPAAPSPGSHTDMHQVCAAPAGPSEVPFSGTAALSEEASRKIAERPATPFEASAAEVHPAPVAGELVPRGETPFSATLPLPDEARAELAHRPDLPFEKGASTAVSRPEVHATPAEVPFSGTKVLTLAEAEEIARQAATPFEAPRRPATPPEDGIAPAVLAVLSPAPAAESARRAPSREPVLEGVESGGLGDAFLAAMADAGADDDTGGGIGAAPSASG